MCASARQRRQGKISKSRSIETKKQKNSGIFQHDYLRQRWKLSFKQKSSFKGLQEDNS